MVADLKKGIWIGGSTTWVHVAMVYRGPNNGQGVTVFKNGQSVGDDKHRSTTTTAAPGTLMIGKLFTGNNAGYCRCQVDELLIWNRQLTSSEINWIKNIV